MAIDITAAPYYDDYDASKGYQRVLFKPGYAVQARELTQMQTALQQQISTFGSHIFQQGSVVIPGNSFADLNVAYIKVNTTSADVTLLEGSTLTGTSGITAIVRKGIAATGGDPATIYIGYISGGNNGEITFADGETVTTASLTSAGTPLVVSTAGAGSGAMAFVNAGVYYVNGSFAYVPKQSVVISKYDNVPSCHVLLKITESIVDSDADSSLLDPAQGSYNYAAPGADRLKVALSLVTLSLNATFTDDYIEIMRYNNGVLEEQARYAKYNELEKSLARRTYDESGDYVVSGLDISTQEHLKSTINGGKYSLSAGGDVTKFLANVTPGKSYINGFENELLYNKSIELYKGRTTGSSTKPEHVKTGSTVSLVPQFGQWLYVSMVKSLPSFKLREVVNLYDAPARNVLTGSAGSGTFSVGETVYVGANNAAATARGIVTAVTGTGATSAITYYTVINSTGTMTEFTGGTQTITGATSNATITTGTKSNTVNTTVLIGTARVLGIDFEVSNTIDATTIYRLYISELSTPGQTLQSIGGVSYSGGSATVVHKLTAPSSGADFIPGEIVSSNLSARMAQILKWDRSTSSLYVYRSNKAVFIPVIGDKITGAYTSVTSVISGIKSAGNYAGNTSIVQLPYTSVYKMKTATNTVDMSYKAFKELTITTDSSGNGSASVSGMTIDPLEQGNAIFATASATYAVTIGSVSGDGLSVSVTGAAGAPVSSTLKIVVSVTKSGVSYKTKTYTPNQVEAGVTPASVITLLKADVYRLVSVVSTIDGDVTSRYKLDNGQRDYAYTKGSITLVGIAPSGTLTITYDYFLHGGSGDYFSVDSYELSGVPSYYDVIPTYVSATDGTKFDLHNCLDFRARAGDDGTYTAGTASTIDIVQPNSRITSSLQYYVPRTDIIVMNKSGLVSAITGIPADIPVAPKLPAETLLLATLYVPAYTASILDLRVVKAKNQGYTMAKISKVDDRLATLEQYTLLTQTESNLVNNDIIDTSTGLSRYKSGYLVDTFDNPDIIADLYNVDFSSTYTSDAKLTPQVEKNDAPLTVTANTGLSIGNMIMLPYTTTVFAKQPLSTNVTNINPFAVYSWVGKMTMVPNYDTWIETEYLPTVFASQTDYTYSNNYVTVTRPWNWIPAGNGRFAPPPNIFD